MLRDFNTPVLTYDGRPTHRPIVVYDSHGLPVMKDGQPILDRYEIMTLKVYALDALSGRWQADRDLTVEQARERTNLVDKLIASKDGKVEISVKEGQLILDCLRNQGRDPIVIARMANMLDTDPIASVTSIAKN